MSGRRSLALCCFLGVGLWSSAAAALEGGTPSIWYRSADGCPDGAAFIGRLHGAAEGAKLAGVADRIDFVVTLGTKDGRAFGRLERQTAEGRAAVRELSATTCDEVADAIALTLTLALAPQANTAPGPIPVNPAPTPPEPATPAAPPPPAPLASAAVEPTPTRGAGSEPSPGVRVAPAPRSSPWLLGADVTGDKGSLPDALLGARLFGELQADAPWHGASLRLAGFFMSRLSSQAPPVDVVRFGARVEACPILWFGPVLELRPCVGLDVGAERARGTASSGVSRQASWVAASALARGTWNLNRAFALEAAAGLTLPLTRYELVQRDPAAALDHTEVVGFSAALGVAFRLP